MSYDALAELFRYQQLGERPASLRVLYKRTRCVLLCVVCMCALVLVLFSRVVRFRDILNSFINVLLLFCLLIAKGEQPNSALLELFKDFL